MLNIENAKDFSCATASERIKGAIFGAAIGDAVAAATDGLTHAESQEIYGTDVSSLLKPSDMSFSAGRAAGDVTDCFSILFYLLNEIVENKGSITKEISIESLLKWADTDYFHFAGMTTRKTIEGLREVGEEDAWAFAGRLGVKLYKGHYYALSSNGSLKSWASALFNYKQQDVTKLDEDATAICLSSHDDILSVSAAVSVARAMNAALSGKTFEVIFDAAIDGAVSGLERGKAIDGIWDYPGPSTEKRLYLALKCAYACKSGNISGNTTIRQEFRDVVGCGPEVAETLPVALGLMLAHNDDPARAFVDAVNIGDETCALSSLVGAFLGAIYGSDIFDASLIEQIESATHFDISGIAQKVIESI